MPTAVVTGATGFLGLNLVESLVEQGWSVIALHRATSKLTYLQRFAVERRIAPLEDSAALLAAIPAGVDALFHVAASVSWWRRKRQSQYQDNVVGTRNVVEAALERQVGRFIHTSSIAAYGEYSGTLTEETISNAATSRIGYLRTKYLAEQEVRRGIDRGLPAVLLNPANIIGPFDTHNWGRSIRLVASGKLPGVPPGGGSFCHVADVVRAHLAAVESGRVGENYILAGVDASFLEFFQVIGRVVGKKVPTRPVPAFVFRAFGYLYEVGAILRDREPDLTGTLARILCGRYRCSIEKAARELGYTTHTLEEMVRDCHDWLVREGLL